PTILAAAIVTATSFLGLLFFTFREKKIGHAMNLVSPLAAGLLLGSALLQLIPASISRAVSSTLAMFAVLVGITAAILLGRTIWHHHHEAACQVHLFSQINLLGEGIQNLVAGMMVASCFWFSASVGLIAAAAVIVHAAVQQLGNFGFLLHGGIDKGRALGYSLASSSTAILGAVLTYFWLLALDLGPYLLAFGAGWFVYMGADDVLSCGGRRGKMSAAQFILLLLGVVIVEWVAMFLV
ncbi:MAG: ZIP family metal transporter, partial [Candidatus Hadarchaeota archaeon]